MSSCERRQFLTKLRSWGGGSRAAGTQLHPIFCAEAVLPEMCPFAWQVKLSANYLHNVKHWLVVSNSRCA